MKPILLLIPLLSACIEKVEDNVAQDQEASTPISDESFDTVAEDREDGDEDRCGYYAEQAYTDCINEGGSEEDCSSIAESAYEDCQDSREEQDEEGEEEGECEGYAEEVYLDCIDEGGSQEECRQMCEDAYEDCLGER